MGVAGGSGGGGRFQLILEVLVTLQVHLQVKVIMEVMVNYSFIIIV
jgi:hypothetical protein